MPELESKPRPAPLRGKQRGGRRQSRSSLASRPATAFASTLGFTLIELMVVVSIISITAAITFSSIRADAYSNAAEQFAEEIGAQVMRARDTAIDEQTEVEMKVQVEGLSSRLYDQNTGAWVDQSRILRSQFGGGVLGEETCIVAVLPLVYAPGQGVNIDFHANGCPAATNTTFFALTFKPDGSYELVTGHQGFNAAASTGWTFVVRDGRAQTPRYALIELYPTGLVRVHPHVTH